jgi:predicted alpha/beta hydrolase family esterase
LSNITKNLYLLPKLKSDSYSDWYPWLKQHLENQTDKLFNYRVTVLDGYEDIYRSPEDTVEFLKEKIPSTEVNENLIIIGHSLGSQAALRYVSTLHDKQQTIPIGGVVCVGGWFNLDYCNHHLLERWAATPIDLKSIMKVLPGRKIRVLISDNDPMIEDAMENQQLWEDRLNASVTLMEGEGQFESSEYEEIAEAIYALG